MRLQSIVGFFLLLHIAFGVQSKELISQESDSVLFQILNMHTKTANQILTETKSANPGLLYFQYLANWNEVIELAAHEDEARYKSYQDSFERRIKRIENDYDKAAPEYNILLGEIYAHGGMANLMFGDFLSGFKKIMKTNRLAKKNCKEHPDFWLNDKLYGILNVSLGQIPPVLKWFTNLLGLTGDPDEGYRRLDRYLTAVDGYPGLKSEALLYYAFGLKLTKDEALACTMFEKNIHPNSSPYLALFVKANLLYKTGKNDDAIDVLEFLHAEDTEIPFHHIDYMTGKAKLNRLDSSAGNYLSHFLEESKTKNYKREVCMRLAYHHYMQGDLVKYYEYKNQTDEYSKATTDRDREADIEKNRKYLPHVGLLKARFLTSGGYFERATQVISNIDSDLLQQNEAKSEYYLLIARIEFGEGAFEEAIRSCMLSISFGKNCKVHYPAEAALLAGDISKVAGDPPAAESYWKQALKLDQSDDVYYEIIQKKAKNKLRCLSKDKPVLTVES